MELTVRAGQIWKNKSSGTLYLIIYASTCLIVCLSEDGEISFEIEKSLIEFLEYTGRSVNLQRTISDLLGKKSDLLPCPFCGGDAKLFKAAGGKASWVQCTNCKAGGTAAVTAKEAIAVWNKRVKENENA